MKNAESLAAVHTHTSTFTNEQISVAFLHPKIKDK